jgi:hypothetical protein
MPSREKIGAAVQRRREKCKTNASHYLSDYRLVSSSKVANKRLVNFAAFLSF